MEAYVGGTRFRGKAQLERADPHSQSPEHGVICQILDTIVHACKIRTDVQQLGAKLLAKLLGVLRMTLPKIGAPTRTCAIAPGASGAHLIFESKEVGLSVGLVHHDLFRCPARLRKRSVVAFSSLIQRAPFFRQMHQSRVGKLKPKREVRAPEAAMLDQRRQVVWAALVNNFDDLYSHVMAVSPGQKAQYDSCVVLVRLLSPVGWPVASPSCVLPQACRGNDKGEHGLLVDCACRQTLHTIQAFPIRATQMPLGVRQRKSLPTSPRLPNMMKRVAYETVHLRPSASDADFVVFWGHLLRRLGRMSSAKLASLEAVLSKLQQAEEKANSLCGLHRGKRKRLRHLTWPTQVRPWPCTGTR